MLIAVLCTRAIGEAMTSTQRVALLFNFYVRSFFPQILYVLVRSDFYLGLLCDASMFLLAVCNRQDYKCCSDDDDDDDE